MKRVLWASGWKDRMPLFAFILVLFLGYEQVYIANEVDWLVFSILIVVLLLTIYKMVKVMLLERSVNKEIEKRGLTREIKNVYAEVKAGKNKTDLGISAIKIGGHRYLISSPLSDRYAVVEEGFNKHIYFVSFTFKDDPKKDFVALLNKNLRPEDGGVRIYKK